MLDTRQWPGTIAEYAEHLLFTTDTLLSDPQALLPRVLGRRDGRMMTAPATRSVPDP